MKTTLRLFIVILVLFSGNFSYACVTVSSCTYLGGDATDGAGGIAVDGEGSIYVIGTTYSYDFPGTDGGAQPEHGSISGSGTDVFVTKLNAAGTEIVYATYLGGSGWEYGGDIVVDEEGNAYVTGSTDSIDFPTVNPYQGTNPGYADPHAVCNCRDLFVTKLNAAGTELLYSTYLGGWSSEDWGGIDLDGEGNVYVAGTTLSADFPTANAFQGRPASDLYNGEGFIAKLGPSCSELVYSTYLGGLRGAQIRGLVVDHAGNAYVCGSTSSADFPIAHAFQQRFIGGWVYNCTIQDVCFWMPLSDAFVTKLDPSGQSLAYSTYLGGWGGDIAEAVTIDERGNAYITGSTTSLDFPVKNAFQGRRSGPRSYPLVHFSRDAFVTKLNPFGNQLIYSTYLGGYGDETAEAIGLDSEQNAYVIGSTTSWNFPVAAAYQYSLGSTSEYSPFITKIDTTGSRLRYSTLLSGDGQGADLVVDGYGAAYICGGASGHNLPVISPLQENRRGDADAFIAKLTEQAWCARPVVAFTPFPAAGSDALTVTFQNQSTGAEGYAWNFGDDLAGEDNYSKEKNPTYTFTTGGDFVVILEAWNSCGYVRTCETIHVTCQEVPVADFAASPVEGTAPLRVSFGDRSVGASTVRLEGGDGFSATLTDRSISHTYTESGVYESSVTATNECGAEDTKTIQIVVH